MPDHGGEHGDVSDVLLRHFDAEEDVGFAADVGVEFSPASLALGLCAPLVRMARRTTSIKIDDALWKRVKMHCLSKDLLVSDFVEKVLRKELDR